MKEITIAELEAILAASRTSRRTLGSALREGAGDEQRFFDILVCYVEWNRDFKSSAVGLVGETNIREDLFGATGAESIAAAIYRATTDEFLGRHGTRAHAMLRATARLLRIPNAEARLACLVRHPTVRAAQREIFCSYGYRYDMNDPSALARALGSHIGSELLASAEEFPELDKFFSARFPEVQERLRQENIEVGGVLYPLYDWVVEHMSVEIDHFNAAVEGANEMIRHYTGRESKAQVRSWIMEGFADFVEVQAKFMETLAVPV